MKAATLMLLAVVALGCERKVEPSLPPQPVTTTAATATVDTTKIVAASADTVTFEHQREYDITGDGVPELMLLRGAGPAWDSLSMRLEIRSKAGAVLYADSFTTMHYTGLDPDPDQSRAKMGEQIRHELETAFEDGTFSPTADNYDEDNLDLRHTYAYASRKATFGANPSKMHLDSVNAVIENLGQDPEYVRFKDDLMKHTMFKYYIGGESSIGITWSSVLNRFVETSACC